MWSKPRKAEKSASAVPVAVRATEVAVVAAVAASKFSRYVESLSQKLGEAFLWIAHINLENNVEL